MARLKVYRTVTGFDDAYVAAPSQKAALAAWGSDKDLFARGAAEVVTDPALTAEPLARPGEVIRRSRGSLAEQLRALGPAEPRKRRSPKPASHPAGKIARPEKPKPPPSREPVVKAEAALSANAEVAGGEDAVLRDREQALARERKKLEAKQRLREQRLRERLKVARERYRAEFELWAEKQTE